MSSGRCVVDEVAAADLLCRLKLAVDAAVTLLQARGVPGQVEVEQIGAAHLQVDAFARGIGADEDAQRLFGGVRVEGLLQGLAALDAGRSGKDADAVIGPVGVS